MSAAEAVGSGRALASALLLSVGVFLPLLLTGALAVQIGGSIQAAFPVVAVAVTLSFIVGGTASLVAGRVVDRIGPIRGLRLAASLTATAMLGAAVSGSSAVLFTVFVAGAGFGVAVAGPAANIVLLHAVPAQRRAVVFGIKQASIPAASLLGGLAVPLIALTVGWQWAFAIALVFPLLALVVTPRDPIDEFGATRLPPSNSNASRRRLVRPPWLEPLFILALGAGLANIAVGAVSASLTPYAVASGYSEGAAGVLVAVASLTGIAVRIGGGAAVDRRGNGSRGALLVVTVLLAMGALGLGLLMSGVRGLVLPGSILSFGAGWGWHGLFQYGVVTTNVDAPGRATGITEGGMQTGGAIGPVLFAWLAQGHGYGPAWLTMALCTGVSVAVIAVGRHRMGQHAISDDALKRFVNSRAE